MNYQAIVFDKDGTLIDFHATWLPVYRYAALEFADQNIRLAEKLLSLHGFDAENQRFLGGSLLAAGNNQDIAEAWTEILHNRVDSQRLDRIFQRMVAKTTTAVPRLKETLSILKRLEFKLGVATSDSYNGIENSLRSFDILSFFDFLCGYDSGHGVKPEAGMVLAFCDRVSVSPAQTIVVGDNPHDIDMGRNAGAGLCVGVLTGTSTRDELASIADVVYDDIGGLLDLIADHG